MKIQQKKWTVSEGWQSLNEEETPLKNSLVFAFGDRYLLGDSYDKIKEFLFQTLYFGHWKQQIKKDMEHKG